MKNEKEGGEFRSGGHDETRKQGNPRDTDADKLSAELTQEPAVDAGDVENADKKSSKTGARYGGRDSGLGIKGTNEPPKG